jgi:hypothetical protein
MTSVVRLETARACRELPSCRRRDKRHEGEKYKIRDKENMRREETIKWLENKRRSPTQKEVAH